MIIIKCQYCNKDYKTQKCWVKRNKYHCCGRKCNEQLKIKNSVKVCEYCKSNFYSKSHQKEKKFCSRKCARLNTRLPTIPKVCFTCGKSFDAYKNKHYEQKYCSKKCSYKGLTIKRCIKFKCIICGKEYFRTKYWVSICKNRISKFCSKTCKDIGLSGKNHPNYNPNKNDEKVLLIEWAKNIKRRDKYTCQECGSNKNLHAHHIKRKSKYRKLKYVLENGITLCNICHASKHKKDICIYNLILNNHG